MTYHNAIKFIKNSQSNTHKEGSDPKRILELCEALGNPQKKIKYIRLAGSNGKTVSARMLISVLNKANIVNGCLSMPIYNEVRENVRINGKPISMEETVTYVKKICQAIASINSASAKKDAEFHPTTYEIMLCISLLAFTAHDCAVCIVESDHNGEDTSRFLSPPFAAIICGKIPSENDFEISKIRSYISRGIREIISAPQDQAAYKIISDTCFSANCRLTIPARNKFKIKRLSLRGTDFSYKDNDYSLRLCGKFQTENALVAIESAEMLTRFGYKISKDNIKDGLAAVIAPCKFEVISISPTIIADSTHSNTAIDSICDSLTDFKELTGSKIRLCLPMGELIPKYIEALQARGYSVLKVTALASNNTEEQSSEFSPCVSVQKNVKLVVKDSLSGLATDELLFISGHSNFTRKIRYELLSTLGF